MKRCSIRTPFRETCIQPAAGDDGIALGAALYVSNSVLNEGERFEMTDAYLGPEYSDEKVKAALDQKGVPYQKFERDQLIEKNSR